MYSSLIFLLWGILKKLWINFLESYGRCRPWDKEQWIRFFSESKSKSENFLNRRLLSFAGVISKLIQILHAEWSAPQIQPRASDSAILLDIVRVLNHLYVCMYVCIERTINNSLQISYRDRIYHLTDKPPQKKKKLLPQFSRKSFLNFKFWGFGVGMRPLMSLYKNAFSK